MIRIGFLEPTQRATALPSQQVPRAPIPDHAKLCPPRLLKEMEDPSTAAACSCRGGGWEHDLPQPPTPAPPEELLFNSKAAATTVFGAPQTRPE